MPFTSEELLRTFGGYNAAFWPVSALLFALAVLMVALTFVRPRAVDRVGAGFLSLLWAWTGVGFHLVFFTAINPAAFLFGALFLAQAVLFARAAISGKGVPMRPAADKRLAMALALVGYALVGYPLVSLAVGHRYPGMPTFGLPCPTTLLTVGMLATVRHCPPHLLVIPAAWSLIGWSAAWQLGMAEDHGLLASAIAAFVLGAKALPWPAMGTAQKR